MQGKCVGVLNNDPYKTRLWFGIIGRSSKDHKLLATIHSAEGDHGQALDCLVYANSIFVQHAQEVQNLYMSTV
jgi:hypothetical protein